jgi:hypothetical protein
MLPFSLIIGMQLWLGFAIISALLSLIKQLLIHKRLMRRATREPPAGGWAFIPVALSVCGIVGVIISLISGRIFLVWIVYTITGLAYGVMLWQLARRGYLPFPDEG